MAVIYGIVHKVSLKAYVGCTSGKPAKRFREHRCLLNGGKHSEPGLQADWAAFGPSAFMLVIFEELGDASLPMKREAELRWMDKLAPHGLLYNTRRVSFSPSAEAAMKGVANAHKERGNRWTAEANEKRRLSQLGKPKGHGAKISATKQAKKIAMQVMR